MRALQPGDPDPFSAYRPLCCKKACCEARELVASQYATIAALRAALAALHARHREAVRARYLPLQRMSLPELTFG
jgi:hypothetical protein